MSFREGFTKILSICIIPACVMIAVHASVLYTEYPSTHHLMPRDLPPCPAHWPHQHYPDQDEIKRELAAVEAEYKDRNKPANWIPSICPKPGWNCVFVFEKVGEPTGEFYLSASYPVNLDGAPAHVQIFHYWQATTMWNTPGGTVLSYMAHGVDYTCVKGTMGVTWIGNHSDLVYDSKKVNTHGYTCDCHYPLDDDKKIYVIPGK